MGKITVTGEEKNGDLLLKVTDNGAGMDEARVRELQSGCACCSLAGDLVTELRTIVRTMCPDQILMEPSGIGKLSEITALCGKCGVRVTKRIVLVDVSAFLEFREDLGPFFLDQISQAGLLLFSHMQHTEDPVRWEVAGLLREYNPEAVLYADDWRELTDELLLKLVQESPDHVDSAGSTEGEASFVRKPGKLFASVSIRDPRAWSDETPDWIVQELRSGKYGEILRVKGYFPRESGGQIYFDLTPADHQWRHLAQENTCETNCAVVIGCDIRKQAVEDILRDHKKAPARIRYGNS